MSTAQLVGFDIPGLQRYVFAPIRPVDVMGGSRLLERFAEQAAVVARDVGANPVYCGGGSGLFTASPDVIQHLRSQWSTDLAELTGGAVEAVTGSVPLVGSLELSRRRLRWRLEAERAQLLLGRPTRELVPAGVWPRDLCQACGTEVAGADDRVGDTVERIGPACWARRKAGRGAGVVPLSRLFKTTPSTSEDRGGSPGDKADPDRPPPGAVLAIGYFDADGLGRILGEASTADDLAQVSGLVRDRVRAAIDAAETLAKTKGRSLLAPIVGGDDVCFFADARLIPALVDAVLDELDGSPTDPIKPRFSGSLLFADPHTPLRHLFGVARQALKQAKLLAHRTGKAHIAIRSLLSGQLHPGRQLLFGGPVPIWFVYERGRQGGPLSDLVGEVTSISERSQRFGLARDMLTSESREEQLLSVEERVVRVQDTGVRRAVEAARRWAAELGSRDVRDVLLGALVLADLWEDAQT